MKTVVDEGLLESAIALSAGLYSRFDRSFIGGQFPMLRSYLATVKNVHRRYLCAPNTVSFRGMEKVADLLCGLKSQRVIFAGSQFGPILMSVAALASIGIKVAGVYWALSESNARILEICRAHFVDLTEHPNRLSLVRLLQKLHSDGYVLWLMCDVGGVSHVQYEYLGYAVGCANLVEVYGRINRCTVVPAYCRVLSDSEVSLRCDPPLTDHKNMTQRLLSDLATQIYEDPINYLWSGTSIIFSDSRAILNGLRYLPDFLEWREQAVGNGAKN